MKENEVPVFWACGVNSTSSCYGS
ncbi:hypothetical protein [Clostridium beijerinckii]